MPGIIGGVYYFFFVTGILLAIWWCMTAERSANDGSTTGLFAMRSPNSKKPGGPKGKPEGTSTVRPQARSRPGSAD